MLKKMAVMFVVYAIAMSMNTIALAGFGNKVIAGEAQGTLPQTVVSSSTQQGTFSLYSRTIAQINALAPGVFGGTATGQLVYCSDCLESAVCVSTGAAPGAWVIIAATSSVVVGGLLKHCN